jgi:UPF0755 protein
MKARTIGTCCVGSAIVIVIIAIVLGRGAASVFFTKADIDAEPIIVNVESGENVTTVSLKLQNLELLEAASWFKWYGRLTGKAKTIKAGEFTFYPGMSIISIYEVLGEGRSAEKQITIIEGWTIADIEKMLVSRGIAEQGEIQQIVNDPEFREEFEFLSEVPIGIDIEGYLYPETYRVFADATTKDIIRKSLLTFESRVYRGLESDISENPRSLFEIVTIASILEREVRGMVDKQKVADLIERRLELGMPLQMDSTVNYVTGKNRPGILLVDRDVESPYNTYKYTGLPIGPISSPGIESIKAVLDPVPNPYLFFLTTPQGEVIYSRTNEEHVANKNIYLR